MALELKTDSGSDDSTCSPSSLTPETYWHAEYLKASNRAIQMERERDEARKILHDIEEIFLTMRPRHCRYPSMDGRYPCWIVWLPKEGTVERKSLTDAIMEFVAQTEIIPENVELVHHYPQGRKSNTG